MSHVPGRIPIRIPVRFHREAHEALAEAIGLCERADRLRADVSRIVADSLAADGPRDISDQAGTVEQLVDLVSEAAGLLGQATWFWAQTISCPVPGISGLERLGVVDLDRRAAQ